MATHKIHIPLLLLAISLLISTINAQNSRQNMLDAHNRVRRQLGIPDVTWSTTLETYARDYTNTRLNDCTLVHSYGDYGENLAYGWGNFSAVDAITMWVDERQYYDYNSNTCAQGQVCGHYTQVVWRNTRRIGCYRARCTPIWTDWVYVMCSYDPPGNYEGEWPYTNVE